MSVPPNLFTCMVIGKLGSQQAIIFILFKKAGPYFVYRRQDLFVPLGGEKKLSKVSFHPLLNWKIQSVTLEWSQLIAYPAPISPQLPTSFLFLLL